MPKLDGILETALYTEDMARSRAFYEGVLGFEPIYSDDRLSMWRSRSAKMNSNTGRRISLRAGLPSKGAMIGHAVATASIFATPTATF
jgi:catechol 2,3-dioxygenase-like lactoylglutathione lyase family enzyme